MVSAKPLTRSVPHILLRRLIDVAVTLLVIIYLTLFGLIMAERGREHVPAPLVDVAGEALSLVVIDRLPFQPPDDPVLAARMEVLRQAGKNPFFDHQLPHAVISLKQGAGRLIRRESDRGVLMICDPRLVDKPYGRRIWQALPPMKRSRRLDEAVGFFTAQDAPR